MTKHRYYVESCDKSWFVRDRSDGYRAIAVCRSSSDATAIVKALNFPLEAFEAESGALWQTERLHWLALEALRPFAAFACAWDAKPVQRGADTLYAIHSGTENAAELTLTMCRAALDAMQKANALPRTRPQTKDA